MRVPHTRPEGAAAVDARPTSPRGSARSSAHTWLWLLIGQALLYHLFYGGAQGVLGPIVVGDEFGRAAWGLALGTLMAGFVVGGLICLRWRPRRGLYVGTVLLCLTAALPAGDGASATTCGRSCSARSCTGSGSRSSTSTGTCRSSRTSPRTSSPGSTPSTWSAPSSPGRSAWSLTGPIAAAVGFDTWLLVVGVIMGGSALLALLSPDVRHLERR